MSIGRTLFLCLVIATGRQAQAQTPTLRDCGAPGGGVVAGTVTYEESRFAGSIRGVWLSRDGSPVCSSVVDTTGAFGFAGVPPGDYSVGLASLGVSPPDPVSVSVAGGDTVRVHLHAAREDALADCAREVPACAAVLEVPPPAGLSATEEEEFRLWRAALALATAAVAADEEWVACVSPDLSPVVRSALATIHPDIGLHGDCALGHPDDPSARWPGVMTHLPSGRQAQSVTVLKKQTPGGPVVELGRVSAGLNGQWWRCELVREAERLVLGRCFTTAVS